MESDMDRDKIWERLNQVGEYAEQTFKLIEPLIRQNGLTAYVLSVRYGAYINSASKKFLVGDMPYSRENADRFFDMRYRAERKSYETWGAKRRTSMELSSRIKRLEGGGIVIDEEWLLGIDGLDAVNNHCLVIAIAVKTELLDTERAYEYAGKEHIPLLDKFLHALPSI